MTATVAELPLTTPDVTSPPPVTGRSIFVAAGGNLQAAINNAQPGDEIVLQAGATFEGPFTLPNKVGNGWITIRSNGPLPGEDIRATGADASGMARLISTGGNQSPLVTASGAHNYYIEGLEITVAPTVTQLTTLVNLGDGSSQNTGAAQPHNIVLDHMYIHGTNNLDIRRGIELNSANTAIINSTISNIHSLSDSQAIAGWNGSGGYLIQNNDLEAAGENVMFGGADPQVPNALPRDITIRGNDFTKPLSWKGVWTVKNLLELKIGQRVLIEDNTFSSNWVAAQDGFAISFKSTDQDGTAPWSQTSDVTFRDNLIENSAGGIALGASDPKAAVAAARFNITDNRLLNIGQFDGTTNGILFELVGYYGKALDSVIINNNIATQNTQSEGATILFDGLPTTNFVFTNNIVTRGGYGIKGSGTGEGAETLATYAPNTVFAGNELVGASPTKYVGYTSQNTFPTTVELNQLPTVELNQQPTMFDGLSYIAQYTDLMNAFGANNDAGVAHYINYGIHEGRSTSFDVAGYEQAHPDLQGLYRTNDEFLTAYINTYTTTGHFLTTVNQLPTMFDGLSYIAQYTDLMNAFGANNDAGVAHYFNYGIHEGRSTSFNVAGYEQAHPDLQGLYRTNDAFLTAYINTYTTTGHFLT